MIRSVEPGLGFNKLAANFGKKRVFSIQYISIGKSVFQLVVLSFDAGNVFEMMAAHAL